MFKLNPNLDSLISKKRKMLKMLSWRLKMNQLFKPFMLKKVNILIIISEKINIWLIKKPELDKRNLIVKIKWWIHIWIKIWIKVWLTEVCKCLWILWWCFILTFPWWIRIQWWGIINMVCLWIEWQETEVESEEVEVGVGLEVECNKNPLEMWWITWTCNNHKLPVKEQQLLDNNLNNKLNSWLYNPWRIIYQNSWN